MDEAGQGEGKSLISTRTMEIVVALLFLVAAGIVISDSLRLGMSWASDGPESGYFPFYIATIMAAASLINLSRALIGRSGADQSFVSRSGFIKVISVLLPLLAFVAAIGYIGIYVASAICIALFMLFLGKYAIWRGLLVGAGVALGLFLMFEIWFLVPLPKGPLEAYLGY